MDKEHLDDLLQHSRKILGDVEYALRTITMPLDDLITLSQLLLGLGTHLGTMSLNYPDDPRIDPLGEQCAVHHAEVLNRADEVARVERFRHGLSIH